MKKNGRKILICSLLVIMLLLIIFPATSLAAPGGMIVKAAAKSLWGKILLGALAIILLPLTIYIVLKEAYAATRTKRDLQKLTAMNRLFISLELYKRKGIRCDIPGACGLAKDRSGESKGLDDSLVLAKPEAIIPGTVGRVRAG